MGLAAVVLAGGRATRLGGVDKAGLIVAGRSLLASVLGACADAGAEPIVVVGPRRPTEVDVRWVREQPPHGGPLAGLAAGLALIPDEVPATAVLAVDLAGLRATTIERLQAAVTEGMAGALLIDADGHPQWLAGVWRTAALRAGLAAISEPAGRPVRALLGELPAARVPAVGAEALDVDTEADLHSVHTGRQVRWIRPKRT